MAVSEVAAVATWRERLRRARRLVDRPLQPMTMRIWWAAGGPGGPMAMASLFPPDAEEAYQTGLLPAQHLKALIDRPHDRTEAAQRSIEGFGGRMLFFSYCFGEFDGVATPVVGVKKGAGRGERKIAAPVGRGSAPPPERCATG